MGRGKIWIVVIAALMPLGCAFQPIGFLSGSKSIKSPPLAVDENSVPSVIGGSDQASIIWQADESDESAEISVSLDGVIWTAIGTVPVNDHGYSVVAGDLLLADGVYNLRLTTPSQSFDLGTVTIDKTAPVVGADQTINDLTVCEPLINFTLNASVDAMSPVTYEIVSQPPLGEMTGCLDGTGSTACSYTFDAAQLDAGPNIITYRAVDLAGNRSAIGTLTPDYVTCF